MTNNINYDNIPIEIRVKPNWVGFKVTPKADGSGWNKLPINVKTGRAASSTDASTWTDFDAAVSAVKNKRYGISDIGYAFDGDGIVGIDIDHCVANGELSSMAIDILRLVSSYTEYSVSGSGVHIIARSSEKFESGKCGDFEIYRSGRFFVFTGKILEDRPAEICDCTEEIQQIYTKYLPHKQLSKTSEIQCVGTVLPASCKPINTPLTALNSSLSEVRLSDEQILEIAMAARNGARFAELWRGDVSAYPSYSEADLALCNMLSFYTAKDEIAMDRLFRESGLYSAEGRANKWNQRHGNKTYGEITIRKAINNCRNVYKPKNETRKNRTTESAIIEQNNCYVKYKGNGENKEITNFIIVPKEVLTMDDGGLLSAELINNQGKAFSKQFQMKDFCNVQSFKKVLNSNTLDLSFTGTENDIELIKQHIAAKTYPIKQGYKGIGIYWKDGLKSEESLYVGEVCTIDGNGNMKDNIVSVAKTQTIKSNIEKCEGLSRFEFEQLGKLLLDYNELPKTVTVLCWCAACFAKAKLWDRGVKFPILVMVGEQGSGKSSTYEKVIKPFFSAGASVGASRVSQFSVIQTASSSNCIPYAIDEYKPSTMDKFKVDLINNFLRDSYDCHEATRGNVDMTVRAFPLLCPVCLIGEESPTESSITERKVELMFSKIDISSKAEQVLLLERNTTKISSFGKSVLLISLKEKSSNLKAVFDSCLTTFNKSYEERIKKNIAVCLVGLYLIDKLCKEFGTDIETVFGVTKEDMKKAIINAFEMYTLDGNTYNKTIVDKTFEVFDRMTDELHIGKHYKKLRDGKEIAFDLKSIYDIFTKYHRDHALKTEVIDYNTFTKQLRKKDYYLRYTNVSLDCGLKKCFVLNTYKLTPCADVSNMLFRMGIELNIQHDFLISNQ